MQIIDIGNAIYRLDQIAFLEKGTKDDGSSILRMYLIGNPIEFISNCTSIEQRDSLYEEWVNAIRDLK